MGITNNNILDCEGNKYSNLNDKPSIDESQIGYSLSDFEILQTLTKDDAPNTVLKARSLNNKKIYSLKEFQNCSNNFKLKQICEELKTLNHPHVIKYYDYFSEKNNLYLINEYINNSDILGFIRANNALNKMFPEVEIWNIILQCFSGLEYMYNINKNNNYIKLKLIDIFIDNEQNVKIGVFGDSDYINDPNKNKINNINLWKVFYMMINPFYEQYENQIPISQLNIYINNIQNNLGYSQELQMLLINLLKVTNNIQQANIPAINNYIKQEYNKKYNKNTSINAVLLSLFSFQKLYKKINDKKDLIKSNQDLFYINNLYLNAVDTLKINQNIFYFISEFRIAMALSHAKLVREKEIDPLLILTFILDKLHKEHNGVYLGNKIIDNQNEQDSDVMMSSAFNTDEEDRTNQVQMLDKFFTYFNSNMNSPISDLFISFIKTEHRCKTCHAKFYSFSNCIYVIFDLSNRMNNTYFDLIKDGFEAEQNKIKLSNSEGKDNNINNICERCFTETQFEESNNYYILNRQLIICFIRGKNYQNNSQIIFKNTIDLRQYIETSDNSPHIFELVGSINRFFNNNGEQFNFINANQNNVQYGQIIMLFYISKKVTK